MLVYKDIVVDMLNLMLITSFNFFLFFTRYCTSLSKYCYSVSRIYLNSGTENVQLAQIFHCYDMIGLCGIVKVYFKRV